VGTECLNLKAAVSIKLRRILVECTQGDEFIAAGFADLEDDIVIIVTSALR